MTINKLINKTSNPSIFKYISKLLGLEKIQNQAYTMGKNGKKIL